ncbi:histidinol-phosphatase HisJ [Planomicrobium sp. YIM 101495]|uniref:histidinol-phosphatase HisJ n=1 Tax=Planomicrobium sp. YIM 101495 TaxID=2665160 RepID=UPI0012B73D5F|nr:histidinol-phosphatase HisJ [Planomicrobium sp. YIM 101495]MTD29559.1 histidinol-phosphatase HisJ [Planomicrobium sp. YIM 101495]
MKRDGHIHTPYCPHGTTDPLRSYVEKAIKTGFTDVTFTEHAPLPSSFTDPTPLKDSGMTAAQLRPYLDEVKRIKEEYKDRIRIRVGLEVDFIAGYEDRTTAFLNEFGPELDDAILSVHFLQANDKIFCADYSADVFMELAHETGSVEAAYQLYYKAVEASIAANLGPYKPKRIGHPTLIHKFQYAHGEKIDDNEAIIAVLKKIKSAGLELDVNSAGLAKPDCREPYPPFHFIEQARRLGIPLVFGSDAHSVSGLHQRYEQFYTDGRDTI